MTREHALTWFLLSLGSLLLLVGIWRSSWLRHLPGYAWIGPYRVRRCGTIALGLTCYIAIPFVRDWIPTDWRGVVFLSWGFILVAAVIRDMSQHEADPSEDGDGSHPHGRKEVGPGPSAS